MQKPLRLIIFSSSFYQINPDVKIMMIYEFAINIINSFYHFCMMQQKRGTDGPFLRSLDVPYLSKGKVVLFSLKSEIGILTSPRPSPNIPPN